MSEEKLDQLVADLDAAINEVKSRQQEWDTSRGEWLGESTVKIMERCRLAFANHEAKTQSLVDSLAMVSGKCSHYATISVRKNTEINRLKIAVAKMSHRKCRECGNEAYHLLAIAPYVLCEECGSQDTRLIKGPKSKKP